MICFRLYDTVLADKTEELHIDVPAKFLELAAKNWILGKTPVPNWANQSLQPADNKMLTTLGHFPDTYHLAVAAAGARLAHFIHVVWSASIGMNTPPTTERA